MKRRIRLTEGDLHNIVSNSVRRIVKEVAFNPFWPTKENEFYDKEGNWDPIDDEDMPKENEFYDEEGNWDPIDNEEGYEDVLDNIVDESVRRFLREEEEMAAGAGNEEEYDDIDEIVEDICAQFGDGPVTIKGTLGLWDGKHVIQPVNCPDIMTAIQKCIGNDGEIILSSDISYDGDVVNLIVSHHDGQNIFKLYHAR